MAALALALLVGCSADATTPLPVSETPTTSVATAEGRSPPTTTVASTFTTATTGTTTTSMAPPITAHTTTTTDPTPTAIALVGTAASADEGRWSVMFSLDDRPVVWSTHLHPFAGVPTVIAAGAVVDQRSLTAALYNGPVIPGLTGWTNGRQVQPAAAPWLVAAFNGGFKLEHNKRGGYVTEGRIVAPMQLGQATLAISNEGQVSLGVFGTDIVDDGSWKSMFQNLYPVVQDGKVSIDSYHVWWGANDGDVRDVTRSGVCTRDDGRLMYVWATPVDIRPFADTMVTMGCRFGMELDINGIWPQFATYTGFATQLPRQGQVLDRRMRVPNRYLRWSEKNFVAFFDRRQLPPGVVK